MSAPEIVALVVLGFAIGAYATAIGTGGGFLIAPILLIRHPGAEPAEVTSASLAVVAIAAITSSGFVLRERRVDRALVALMAIVAIPSALLGAAGTTFIPRVYFALGFAALLVGIAAYVLLRPTAGLAEPVARAWRRELVDREGNRYTYRIPVRRSVAPNVGSAFLSALAGIGGGPIGVPMMTRLMRVPHAIAVPSMHVLIAVQASVVVGYHVAAGNVGGPMSDVLWLGIGVVLANPLGQYLRRRLGEGILMRALAVGILIIAARTAYTAF